MDAGNPACLVSGALTSCDLPASIGGGTMVYAGGAPTSTTIVNDPFCSAIPTGTVINVPTGSGGAYISGSSAQMVAQASAGAAFIYAEVSGSGATTGRFRVEQHRADRDG